MIEVFNCVMGRLMSFFDWLMRYWRVGFSGIILMIKDELMLIFGLLIMVFLNDICVIKVCLRSILGLGFVLLNCRLLELVRCFLILMSELGCIILIVYLR